MILTASEIAKQLRQGNLTISPYDPKMLNPNSYNYHLGEQLSEVADGVVEPGIHLKTKVIMLPKEGYVLMPNKLYLGHTFEKIGSKEYVTSLIGRSSVGRLGLFMQITADLGQLGEAHCWTLELKVVQPLRIYPLMRIGQLSFWKAGGKIERTYSGGYAAFDVPRHSKFHKEGNI